MLHAADVNSTHPPHPILHSIDPDENFFNEVTGGLQISNESKYFTIEQYNSAFINSSIYIDFMSVNVRSWNKNGDKFISLFKSLNNLPHVIVLTETWLTMHERDTCLLDGYTEYHTVRHLGRSGGVSVLCTDGINTKCIQSLTLCNQTIETSVVQIDLDGSSFVVFAVYRPHSDTIENFNDTINAMLHSDVLKGKSLVLIGDINIDLLKYELPHVAAFSNTMQSLSFTPVITKATRFPPPGSDIAPSLLDHIWINKFSSYIAGIILIDNTDHCPAFLKLPIEGNKCSKIKLSFRSHSPDCLAKFEREIPVLLSSINYNDDINATTSKLISDLNLLYTNCFPVKIKYITQKRLCKPWITAGILTSIKTKSRYFKLLKLGIIDEHINRKYRNTLNTIIRLAKRNYYVSTFNSCQSNIKKTWNLIRQLLSQKNKTSNIKSIVVNGSEIIENSKIAEHFNNYFANIAHSLDSQIPPNDQSPYDAIAVNNQMSAFFRPVTSTEVCNIIAELKNTTTNINEIPVRLLKKIRNQLSVAIVKLINKSISRGVFPQCLKTAKIIPIFKKGDAKDICNFRPIAILPVLSKVFERCIANRLLDFLCKSDVIYRKQFGFVKGKSTIDAFIELTEYIYRCLNNKEYCISIFLDLTKAFDTVNHGVLLGKLERYGVRGLPLQWFASYLKDRQQYVSISGQCSSQRTINIGIPQGSIIGPILFLLYVNDLPNITSKFLSILYADDTTLLSSNSDYPHLVKLINDELPKIQQWTATNRLSVSLDKTYAMVFTNRDRSIANNDNIYFNGSRVKFKVEEDFLGLVVDDRCKFTKHVDYICKKVSKTIGIIYRLKDFVPRQTLINLYYSLAYPYLLYANLIWGGTGEVHLAPLVTLQKKLIRLITHADFLAHTEPLFKETNILKFSDLHKFVLAQYMYKQKALNSEMFETIHNYDTRNHTKAQQTFQRLTRTQQSVTFAGPKVWNALPLPIRESLTLSAFKGELKKYYIAKYKC